MSKKQMSTYDRMMQNPEFKNIYEKEIKEFTISEFFLALMEEGDMSMHKLAKAVNLSPSVIQKLRNGKQKDLKLTDFMNIAKEFGYTVVLEKGENRISLNG